MKREIKEKMEDIILTKLEELKDTEDPEKRKELIAEISKMCNMKNEEEKIRKWRFAENLKRITSSAAVCRRSAARIADSIPHL